MSYLAQPTKSPFGHVQVHQNADGTEERNGGETYALKLPFTFATTDGTVLYTIPYRSRIVSVFWEITTGFTGGSSSAIGLSSSQSPHDASGDVHGGSAGDVAATLVAGVVRGTQGLSITATPFVIVLDPGATIKFNRITSAFTAGVGYAHVELRIVA